MTINQSKRTLKFCLNYSVQEKLVFESSHWNTCYKAFLNSIRWVNDSQKNCNVEFLLFFNFYVFHLVLNFATFLRIRTLGLLTWALLFLLGFASVRLITCPNCYPVPLAGASINLTGKYQLSHPVGNVLFKVHCYRNCNTSQWLKSATIF